MKVCFFDKKLREDYWNSISIISTIISFVLIFVSVPDDWKIKTVCAAALVVILIVLYICKWQKANKLQNVSMKINKTSVTIKCGDIFKEEGLKVIAFNEYFDTIVDDEIISRNSLNGIFINSYVSSVDELDNAISTDEHLKKCIFTTNSDRTKGKQIRYKLGSMFKFNEYLLLAFSKFDVNNRAQLGQKDFIKCLLKMWQEIDIFNNGYTINIPLLGSGMTVRSLDCTEQELVEALLTSLRLSGLRLNNNAKINIVIYGKSVENINFYKLLNYGD